MYRNHENGREDAESLEKCGWATAKTNIIL